jgi:hypothetical protein
MVKKKTSTALPPQPHTVRVAVHAPQERDPAGLCTLGNKCIAGGTSNPKTIGLSPYLPQVATGVATVQPLIEPASRGGVVEKANLRAAAKVLRTAILGHGGWVDNAVRGMSAADGQAYAVAAGFTTVKAGHHPVITAPGVKHGPVGSGIIECEFPNPAGRCLCCSEYSLDGEKSWIRGPDTEKSHMSLPPFTLGQSVVVRLRMFLRGTGYTPWVSFTIVAA